LFAEHVTDFAAQFGFEVIVGADVTLKAVGALLGDGVGSFVGRFVGSKVGEIKAGADVGQLFATLISTSAQFQNCSGTPRPSGGTTSQTETGKSPGSLNPSGQSYVS